MAKDGTMRGGMRAGSGRKAKPLAEKITEGKTAKLPLNTGLPEPADFVGEDMPPIK